MITCPECGAVDIQSTYWNTVKYFMCLKCSYHWENKMEQVVIRGKNTWYSEVREKRKV